MSIVVGIGVDNCACGWLQELQDRVAKAKDFNEEMIKIRKEIVDFHGEMVLLENYSALNYTGNFTLRVSLM